jgi:hypothetical protein
VLCQILFRLLLVPLESHAQYYTYKYVCTSKNLFFVNRVAVVYNFVLLK